MALWQEALQSGEKVHPLTEEILTKHAQGPIIIEDERNAGGNQVRHPAGSAAGSVVCSAVVSAVLTAVLSAGVRVVESMCSSQYVRQSAVLHALLL